MPVNYLEHLVAGELPIATSQRIQRSIGQCERNGAKVQHGTRRKGISVGISQGQIAACVSVHVLRSPTWWKELNTARQILCMITQDINGLQATPESYSLEAVRLCSIVPGP